MNATTALCIAFLEGRVLSIRTGFMDYGVTNLPREVGRSIERKFGVALSRVKRVGVSRNGVPCWWYEYRLPDTAYNEEGRKKMLEYIKNHANPAPAQKEPPNQKWSQLNLL